MTNFNAIPVPGIDGTIKEINVKKDLGNALYYQSQDIAGSELGRNIYFSEGPMNLTEEEKMLIRGVLPNVYAYVVRKAIEDAL